MLLRSPSEFRFTDAEWRRLLAHFPYPPPDDFRDDCEMLVRWWRRGEIAAAESEKAATEFAKWAKRGRRKKLPGILFHPRKRGPKSLDFARGALLVLAANNIRIARGLKFKWLKVFLKDLCHIAGAHRAGIDRALEFGAKASRNQIRN